MHKFCSKPFNIDKGSIGSAVSLAILLKMDSGYHGLASYHCKSELPAKRSKRRSSTAEEKLANRRLSSERVLIDLINRQIKIFKIMSFPYRKLIATDCQPPRRGVFYVVE